MARYGFDPETGRLNVNPEFFRAGAPDPHGRPSLSAAPAQDGYWRDKPSIGQSGPRLGQGGQGDDLHMLGERMNPLTEAGMFFAGVPTAVGGSSGLLASAATAYGFMEGMNYLSENHPDAARYASVGMAAAAVPGIIRAARGKAGAFINEAAAEPTPQKVNLLKAMYDDWLARNLADVTKDIPAGPEGPVFHHSPPHHSPVFHHPDVPHPVRTIPYVGDIMAPTPATTSKKAPAATPGQSGIRATKVQFGQMSPETQDGLLQDYLTGKIQKIPGVSDKALRTFKSIVFKDGGTVDSFVQEAGEAGLGSLPFAEYFQTRVLKGPQAPSVADIVRRPAQRIGEAWTSLSEERQDRALVEFLNGLTDGIKGVPGSLLRRLRKDIPRSSMSAFAADEVANGVAFPFANYFKRLVGRNEARANAGDLAYLARLEDLPGYRLFDRSRPGGNIFDDGFVKNTGAYDRWVYEFGSAEADSFLKTLRDPAFRRYFYGDDPVFAASEMETYAKARKTINAVTEPYEIVLGGSAGISQEGRIGRGSAVPHDLDFSGYIANASREPLRPGGLTEEARARVAAALTDHANIENAPVILKLRELYPELRDATFRYATRDWEFGGGSQYEPGAFTVPKVSPSFTKEGYGNMLVTTVVDGQNVDIMLSDGEIRTALGEPRFGSADTAFAWKRAYGDARWSGLRPKDAADIAFYEQYGPGNKIVEPTSGRARYAPFKFADRLIDSDGIPVVAAVEETPGGKKVPMFMNYKGEMLRADDPYWLQLYDARHPANNPAYRDGPVATRKSHPLVNVRITRDKRADSAPGEAAPSAGVFPANDPDSLAAELLAMGDPVFRSRRGVVRVYPREVSDPRADLSTRLLGGNGYTGYLWEPESTKRLVKDWEFNPMWPDYLDAVDKALAEQTPQNLDRLGRIYGELTRPYLNRARNSHGEFVWNDFNPEFTQIDSTFRKYIYDRVGRAHVMPYPGEAKPMRYVPHYIDVDSRSPDAHERLSNAIRKMSYAVPLAVGLGLSDDEGGEETREAAKAGKSPDRFALSRNFLAQDKVPDSLFGIPIAADEGSWTGKDIAFFRKHPEAGGYYDMGDGEGAPEEPPMQAADKGGYGWDRETGTLRVHPGFKESVLGRMDPHGRPSMSAGKSTWDDDRPVMYDVAAAEQPRDMTLVDFAETGRNLRRGNLGKVFDTFIAVAGMFGAAGGKKPAGKGRADGRAPMSTHRIAPAAAGKDAAARPGFIYPTNPDVAYRVTGQGQIDDMAATGLIRAGGRAIGRGNNVFWTRGADLGEGRLPYGYEPGNLLQRVSGEPTYILEYPAADVEGSIGGLPVDRLLHVWTTKDGKFVDVRGDLFPSGTADAARQDAKGGESAGASGGAGTSKEPFALNGNLRTEGRMRYLFRDDEGKVMRYGTQYSVVMPDSDGTWVAIPTIIDGREPLTPEKAYDHYLQTGEFFHRGKTREEAEAGSVAAHDVGAERNQAWWNNYIADHLYDGTLSTVDEDMVKTVNDPAFLRWAAGEEKGVYERRPGDSDAELRIERRRRAILDGRIEPNAIDRKSLPVQELNRARKARKAYIDRERAKMGPGGRKAADKAGSTKKTIPAPIVRGPIHYGPPPPPTRGKYPGVSNNPGNVEKHERRSDKTLFKGEVAGGVRPKRFANFSDPVDGLIAAAAVLSRRAAGLAAKGLPFTIENYVPGYAPKSENDTEGYINNLSKYSGFARDAVLDTGNAEDMAKLLRNVVRFESGVPSSEWFTDEEYRRAARAMNRSPESAPSLPASTNRQASGGSTQTYEE